MKKVVSSEFFFFSWLAHDSVPTLKDRFTNNMTCEQTRSSFCDRRINWLPQLSSKSVYLWSTKVCFWLQLTYNIGHLWNPTFKKRYTAFYSKSNSSINFGRIWLNKNESRYSRLRSKNEVNWNYKFGKTRTHSCAACPWNHASKPAPAWPAASHSHT